MSEPQRGVRPPVAVAFAAVGFFALLIAGFGLLSLLTDAEVLPVAGLGQVPGAVGTGASVVVFAATAWVAVRRPQPSYVGVLLIVVATFLAYLVGVLVGAVLVGADAARTIAAIGAFATSWFAVVLAVAALVAGWAAIALVRTRASRPRWPWEHDD
ncbi:MAG: hypothetical protein ABS62_13705 [Microbacterium sp. SCN 70-200]|uniref:DUF6121 family protein n=1 Tax=unclassified Microbacterium TaxID=2609290 RepID=UPI00086896F8|nr:MULTISPECIES: DUF6121 family protein [unclassified Microbacterium]MBN9215104.1 hypothetical protein [Microbacterium sp.]ODT39270.1 MAG: hypothetical protein ABS62_13705 [Microbacterium sp. SCN 70-200]OJV85809.1 MAG: hypothetical protein BGO46_09730 [Microbacterium sp. 70-16]